MSKTDPISKRMRDGVRNALELARLGRFGEPYSAPFEIVDRGEHHRLRRYTTDAPHDAPAALLIPPLMVTAEIYDMAADVSAVVALGARGIQPFVVDFGAPERETGGMTRTLDDHVRAVIRAIERVHAITGRDVHVGGYSQGGMFAYQAAAYLHTEHVKSIVTFGAPVDIHRNLPAVRSDVTGALVRFVEPAVARAIDRIEGLPGFLTSTGFKILSPRAELQQRFEFVRLLHDRAALARREARRNFLGGEGFVAWPGPALRAFIEDFVVHNRMLSGGFVIDGHTVTLADLTCPILAFLGSSDEIARPSAVRAIVEAAPHAEVSFASVPAGHFGIVVGSRSMRITWPTMAEWIHWREGTGPQPEALRAKASGPVLDDELEGGDFDVDVELFVDTAKKTLRSAWRRLGDATASASDAIDSVRWQEPRLRRLAELSAETRVGPGLALAEQARLTPEATFFLWRERAFSYGDADARVSRVVRGLFACGVRPGQKVGVVMGSRPSFLTMVTALSRLGATPVIAPPEVDDRELAAAFARVSVDHVATDPSHATQVHRALGRTLLVLGGGGATRELGPGFVDMEAIDPATVTLPEGFEADPGRARDLAMILLRPASNGELRAAPVTNHRWALSSLGAAAACTLKPVDTVYCCVPLHHPTGILASVGAAVASGARLALGELSAGGLFEPERFLDDVRRYGATVAFYAGEMLRPLLFAKVGPGERSLPLRVFAGSGMRRELAERLRERFGVGTIEFYAGTTHKVILAGVAGEKPGSLGRPLPGSAAVAVLRCDLAARRPIVGPEGRCERAAVGEPGLLAARVDEDDDGPAVLRDVLVGGDRWFISGDVVLRDEDGDVWFVDALSGFVATAGGPVSTRHVEDALYAIPEVRLAAAWEAGDRVLAGVVTEGEIEAAQIEAALATTALAAHERPAAVLGLQELPLTDGFRPRKSDLPREVDGGRVLWRMELAATELAGAARG